MVATQDAIDASTDPVARVAPPRPDSYNRFLNWLGIAIVAVCCIYIFIELQPRLLFLNTTPTGGDTGAHVWFPAYLRDHLLPWRVAGWSDASYAGFPAGQFYFPFPALLIVLLDVVLPYNIAFKLVTALGPVLMPIGAYVFARGIRVPRPAAPLFAVGATAFLFFKDGGDAIMRYDHHIMGGTLTNTLAGEYSFTIAVACSLLFLGTLAMALESRRRLWIPALFLAFTITSHLVVGVFALVGALVIWLCSRPRKSTGRAVAIGAVGVALTAAWLVPLAATLKYTTDMRYEPVGTGYTDPWLLGRLGIELPTTFDWLFLSEMWFLFLFGIVAIGAGIAYRRRATLIVGATTFLAGTVFCGWELLRDVFGKAPGVEPAPAAVLVPHALPARGAGRRGDRTLGRAVRRVGGARFEGRRRCRPETAAPVADAEPPLDDADEGPPLDVDVDDRKPVAVLAKPREGNRHLAIRLVVIGVVAALFATVALVRINATKGYVTYWAKYNYTGLRRWHHRRRDQEGLRGVSSVHRHGERAPAGSLVVGAELRHRPVRHAARTDDAAVLDRRPHQLDGRSVLRVVGDDAVPLPDRGHAHVDPVERGARIAVPELDGVRARRAVPPTAGHPLLRGDARHAADGCRTTRRCAKSPPFPTSTSARRSGGRSTRWPTHPSSRRCASNRSSRATSMPTRTGGARGSPSPHRARRSPPSWARGSAWPCPGSTIPPRSTGRSPTTGPRTGSGRRCSMRGKWRKRPFPT